MLYFKELTGNLINISSEMKDALQNNNIVL